MQYSSRAFNDKILRADLKDNKARATYKLDLEHTANYGDHCRRSFHRGQFTWFRTVVGSLAAGTIDGLSVDADSLVCVVQNTSGLPQENMRSDQSWTVDMQHDGRVGTYVSRHDAATEKELRPNCEHLPFNASPLI